MGIDISAVGNQDLDHDELPIVRCPVQRGSPTLIAGVRIGPAIEQELNHIKIVFAASDPKRGDAHFVFGVHIRAGV